MKIENNKRSSKCISSVIAEWNREKLVKFWSPNKQLLASIRGYQKYKKSKGVLKYISKIFVLKHMYWSVITGADIPLNTEIGGGLLMPHPNGIVISPRTKIGVNCLIFQQVTLGSRGGGAPVIGGHVDIGAGAKILGNVIIGDHVKVGANAVVLHDVPSGSTVVGIPAQSILSIK